MKYTRYDFRKKRTDMTPLVVMLISILLVAFALGTGLSKVILKGTSSSNFNKLPDKTATNNSGNKENQSNNGTVKSENVNIKFIGVQCGVYEKKENADDEKNKLKAVVAPFSVEDGNRIRVMAGIFLEEEANSCIKLLNEKGFQTNKNIIEINKSDLCDAEIAEIISSNIQIINKLFQKDVSGYQTEKFKKWINSDLPAVDQKSKNFVVLEELKKYENSLPEQMNKDKIEENYIYIYNTLKKTAGK